MPWVRIYMILFAAGSMMGWVLELFYRRFLSSANPERRWVNPGFLTGPVLPLYGFALCVLYTLSRLRISVVFDNAILSYIVRFLVMGAAMTLVEYVAGLIFVKGMKIKLWDYSSEWGNIQGIICPRFSLYWLIIGILYFFLMHPGVEIVLAWLGRHPFHLFFLGGFYGIFALDLAYSMNLVQKISQFAHAKHIVVKWEELKAHIRESKERGHEKARFLLAMYSRTSLAEHLARYQENRAARQKLIDRFRQYRWKRKK